MRRSAADCQHVEIDDLLAAALQKGEDTLETGRYIITYKEDAAKEGVKALQQQGLRIADARDFTDQAVTLSDVGDADALMFPEIGAAVVSGPAFMSRCLSINAEIAEDSPIEAIEPEYFAFAASEQDLYLRGFRRAAQAIEEDLRSSRPPASSPDSQAAAPHARRPWHA